MSAQLSVQQARGVLRDTSGLSFEQIDAAEKALAAFRAARPANRQCVACFSMIWSEHETSAGGAVWACAGCHRPASLTAEQWHAQQIAERQAAEAHLAAAAAAAPKPRDALREALGRQEAARKGLAATEAALPAARAARATAQTRHDAATMVAEEVNGAAAARVAASFFEGTEPTGALPSAAAARAELAEAADALAAARGAKALLDGQIADARTASATAQAFTRKAAIAVLASEQLEGLLIEAAEARATYLESIGSLAWLLRSGAIASSDARARQIVAGADTAPSAWPEAKTAGVQTMETALSALLADAEAAIA